jgi:hypothetical protein
VGWVGRVLTVEFGPSRSKRFVKAVALAQGGPGECSEIEPGRYRVGFWLGADAAIYSGLGRLLERVRHWRATEVYEDDDQLSVFHTKEMAWCASFHLERFGECRERFLYGVLPRCGVCPLFDAERAIRAGIPPELAPWRQLAIGADADAPDSDAVDAIVLAPALLEELLSSEPPDWLDLSRLYPDTPPGEWGEADGDTRPR